MQVNALGRFTGELGQDPPVAGHNLKLSLDVGLQKAGESALAQSIAPTRPSTAARSSR